VVVRAEVIIRADGSEAIGMGHIVRCSSLAAALSRRGASVHFALRPSAAAEEHLEKQGQNFTILDDADSPAGETERVVEIARRLGAKIGVVDHYSLDPTYHRALREATGCLACIDDNFLASSAADIVINQNLHADAESYEGKVSSAAKLLLGPRYALLRLEFARAHRETPEIHEKIERVLISFGGGDPENATALCLRGLDKVGRGLRIDAVVGAAFEHHGELEELIPTMACDVMLHRDIDYIDRLMLEADLAFCAGGTTCWEIQCLGLPSIITVLAENQQAIAESLHRYRSAICLGRRDDLDESAYTASFLRLDADKQRRGEMSALALELVDGLGADRVAAELYAAL